MKIDTLDQQQIEYEEQWNASNDHWVFIDETKRLQLVFTIPARVKDFKYGDLPLMNIGHVNQEAYSIMKKCILSKGAACYVDIDEQEIHYHRLIITTDYMDNQNAPSEFVLNIDCIDDLDEKLVIDNLKVEKSKRFKKRLRFKKTDVGDNTYIIRLDDPGDYNFRISGNVKGDKLKCYLNCHRI